MNINKTQLEQWFSKTLCALIEHNGGSIESSLDDMGIRKESERDLIKKWFGWEDEEDELPNEDEIFRPNYIDDEDEMENYVRDYLENEYDHKVKSFDFSYDMRKVYIEEIKWKK